MKKSTLFTLLTVFLLIPLTLFGGKQLPGRWYYLTSTLIVLEILIPFFVSFESRKPQARELVVIAVLCAIASVSRMIVPVPHFKPVFAVIMICGIAFGPQTGFLIGAMSALISNFFAGQGPWTPWQMLAYGAAGLLAGAVAKIRWMKKPMPLAVFGFLAVPLCVGLLLDLGSVFTMLTTLNRENFLFMMVQGIPMNIANGVSTALTMLIFAKPLLNMLERIQVKYGMLDI